MAKLTEELRLEHQDITAKLNKVREMGIGSPEAQKLLYLVKESLIAHLQKEDKELYPVLKQRAQTDEDLNRIMVLFAKDMDSISKAAMNFFNKYEKGGSGIEFSKDFGRLFVTLSGRISKEEDILYKNYDQIVG